MRAIPQALILSVPLVISGLLHMAIVKLNVLAILKTPIHQKWFGANKTWRGVLVVPLTAVIGVMIASSVWPVEFRDWNPLYLGCLLGLAYVLFELPNSFIKRRAGIEPGKRPPRNAALFALADQADSAIGCALVYSLTLRLSLATFLLLIVIGPAVHAVVNFSLYLMRLRNEPI
jgi:hypothetical protein